MIEAIKRLFSGGKKARIAEALRRGYQYLASIGGQNSDWILSGISEDLDVKDNIHKLRARCRDLWKENPYIRKFRRDLLTNVFGANGISLQMKITEREARPIKSEGERAFLESRQRDRDERRAFLAARGIKLRARSAYDKEQSKAVPGKPDVYANDLIEAAWKRWGRRENCTLAKRASYRETRNQRLTMAARDGACFIRLLRGKAVPNEFNFAIQLIPDEYCDHELNGTFDNGNTVRMGIEFDPFGAVVAYYFIVREPGDWQYSVSGGAMFGGRKHERVEARDIIHYSLFEDSNSSRGVPWISSAIPKARQLDKYEEAEVISARVESCKGGHYVPTMAGLDSLQLADAVNLTSEGKQELTEGVEPGGWKALPFGWDAKPHDPRHPNGNYGDFRKNILRGVAAGLPGSNYNSLGSDYSDVNYSSFKAARIDCNEVYQDIQAWDIDTAERAIFEAWLEMALLSGAIPLPVVKFDKFNAPRFQGRRWKGLEPAKEAAADEKQLGLVLTSRTRLSEERGEDWEEILEEQIYEKALLDAAGLKGFPGNGSATEPDDDEEEEETPVGKPKPTPAGQDEEEED